MSYTDTATNTARQRRQQALKAQKALQVGRGRVDAISTRGPEPIVVKMMAGHRWREGHAAVGPTVDRRQQERSRALPLADRSDTGNFPIVTR